MPAGTAASSPASCGARRTSRRTSTTVSSRRCAKRCWRTAARRRRARAAFDALPAFERDSIIEFLKSLQVLPPGTNVLAVDERGRPRSWHSLV